MQTNLPQHDPRGAYRRQVTASRRLGSKQCACGEARPQALIAHGDQTICAECERKQQGKATSDQHHAAGAANDPMTIPIPVNDHRADLSVSQNGWPKDALENPDGCPLLRAAASVLGFIDTAVYLIKTLLLWIADMLKVLSVFLAAKLGPKWWVGTPVENFAPRSSR